MSKEKKEVHHISQVVDKLATMMAKDKNSKKKNQNKNVPQGHPRPKRTADFSQQQGEYAAASVFFPEQLPGARVPDRVAIPTATTQTRTTLEAKSVTYSSGNALWVRFLPSSINCIKYPLTSTGDVVASELSAIMNGDSSLAGMTDQIRVVSASIRLTSTDTAFNTEGVWYAVNHKSETSAGTLVAYNPFRVAPDFKNRASGKFTADNPSMRFVWFPGDEEDQDFEPYPLQFSIDNTVTDIVVLYSTPNHSVKIDVVMNLEYAPTADTSQIVSAYSVVADPSTYGQALQQGMANVNMKTITSTSYNDDVSKVREGIKSVTSVVGDIASGNWLGAVKDGISGVGSVISGAKAGFNLISNAVSSWFGLTPDSEHILRSLVSISRLSKERKDAIRAEFDELVERKLLPVGILDVFAHIEMSNFKLNYEKQANGRMHIVSITSEPVPGLKVDREPGALQDASPVIVPRLTQVRRA